MICSGCGKDIPFSGKVCPHCQRDKSKDQQTQFYGLVFGFTVGGVGYLINGLGAALIGFIVGSVGGIILAAMSGSDRSPPPEVRIVEASQSPTVDTAGEPAARLARLEELRSRGLISEVEFNSKRQQIIDSL